MAIGIDINGCNIIPIVNVKIPTELGLNAVKRVKQSIYPVKGISQYKTPSHNFLLVIPGIVLYFINDCL